MSNSSMVIGPQPAKAKGHDVKVMTLISVGHFLSHFYILILPPLFPLLTEVYGVGYVKLGLALGLLNITTAITQAPVGFLVDRFGARGILMAGLGLFSLATALIGVFPTYPALIVLMVLAGLGNAVFHPADYSILSASIASKRMGRAFSIHTFAGFAGFAAAPPVVVYLTSLVGWQWALFLSGAAGMLIMGVMLVNSNILADDRHKVADDHDKTKPAASSEPRKTGSDLGMLFSFKAIVALLLFTLLALSHGGITAYSVAAIEDLYGLTLAQANAPLTAYLVASTIGVLAGGWLADRTAYQDRLAAIFLVLSALTVLPIAALAPPLWLVTVLIGACGFFVGAIAPSRDLMVKAITPEGASGKMFGFVMSGFNIGGLITPFIFGFVMDQNMPRLVFWLVAAFSLITLVAVFTTGREARRSIRARQAPAPSIP